MERTPDPGATMPLISILLLAAGASARMRGADKLLEEINGKPLVRHLAQEALGTGFPVLVTLPENRPKRVSALQGLKLDMILIEDAAEGMAMSLRSAVAAIPPTHAALVLLADMPEICTSDLDILLAAFQRDPNHILRATTAEGVPGHPVLFPNWARAELLTLEGDIGAKPVLKAHADAVRLVALPANHATTDLDSPEDWAAWRKTQITSGA